MIGQKKIAMIVAEFLGVFTLSLVFYSMLARTTFPLFSGLAAGLTLGVLTLVIGSVSEAHVNPAVTVSMWVMRKIGTFTAIAYIAAQVLGGLVAWALIQYFIGHSLTNLAGAKFDWHVAIAEGIGTAVFAFGAAAAMIQKLDTARTAFVMGASYALGIMVASLAANGLLNPAVALGIHSWDWSYAVAPLFGAVVGSNLYAMLYMASTSSVKSAKKAKR